MQSIKKSAVKISIGIAASLLLAPVSWAAVTVTVNNETPLNIQATEGFSYLTQSGSGALNVATDGFMFCGNVGTGTVDGQVVLVPSHGDWAMPTAVDLRAVSYGSGTLQIDRGSSGVIPTTLACHTLGPQGEIMTSLSEGLFRNGYEAKAVEQYGNMINWIPSQGFNWQQPDWSLVPVDPCTATQAQPAAVVENVTCAGVSAQRPAAAGATTRAPIIWTGTDGTNFFYVVRVDARYGAQIPNGEQGSVAPQQIDAQNPDGSTGTVAIKVVDAYDRGDIGQGGPGYLADVGQYCVLTDLPTTLDGNLCTNAVFTDQLNGPLDYSFSLSILPPANPRASFYFGFIRPIVGAPPALTDPAVAVSILIEPAVSAEGGDLFKGDDVVFGFLPTSNGFPWMTVTP